MPLTPTDVANKQFKIVFRGYSLDEVDGFLDEVESELTRLMRDNNDLRNNNGDGNRLVPAFTAAAPAQAEPAAATPAADVPPADVPAVDVPVAGAGDATTRGDVTAGEPAAAVAQDEPAVAPAEPAVDPELQRVAASGDGGRAALRMLQMAQQTAEQAIAEARAEAAAILDPARSEADSTLAAARAESDSTLAAARAEADSTLTAARAEAEQLLAGTRERAAAVDAEIAQKVEHAMGDLEVQRTVLERNIEQLREFEREYRRRLTSYLESQLQELGSTGTAQELEAPQAVDLPADGDEPSRGADVTGAVTGADGAGAEVAGQDGAHVEETPRVQGWS